VRFAEKTNMLIEIHPPFLRFIGH